MSSKILFALTGGLIGWVVLASKRADLANAQSLTVVDAKSSADVGESQDNIAGSTAILGAVDDCVKGESTLGGSPVAGVDDNNKAQVLPVAFAGPSGEPSLMIADPTGSLGGGDPSTLRSGVNNSKVIADPAARSSNDFVSTKSVSGELFRAAWGDSGEQGTTRRMQADKYGQLGVYTGEVW